MPDEQIQVEISAIDRASEVFRGLSKASDDLVSSISSLITPTTLLSGLVGGGLVMALKSAVDSFEDFALQVRDLAYISGGTVEQVSDLVNGLNIMGVSTSQVERMMSQMARAVESGSTAFSTLGISIKYGSDAQATTLSTFLQTIDALGRMTDTTQRDAIARQLWGRTWVEMVPVLSLGAEKLMELGAASQRAMTPEDIANAEAYHIAMAQLGQALSSVGVDIGKDLVPQLTQIAQVAGPGVVAAGRAIVGVFQEADATIALALAPLLKFTSAFAYITDAAGVTKGAYESWSNAASMAWDVSGSMAARGVQNIGALGSALEGLTGRASSYQAALTGTTPGGSTPDAIAKLQDELDQLVNKYYAVWAAATAGGDTDAKLAAQIDAIEAEREKALNEANTKFKALEGANAEEIGQLRANIDAAANAKIEEARLASATKISQHDAMVIAATEKLADDNLVFVGLTEQQKTDAVREGADQRALAEGAAYVRVHDAMVGQTDEFEEAERLKGETVTVTQQGILEAWTKTLQDLAHDYGADSAAYQSALLQAEQVLNQSLADGKISWETYFTVLGQLRRTDQQLADRAIQDRITAEGLGIDQALANEAGYYTKVESNRQTNLKNLSIVLAAEADQQHSVWLAMEAGAVAAYAKLGTFWGDVSKGFESTFLDVQRLGSDLFFDTFSGNLSNLTTDFENFGKQVLRTFSDILANAATRELIGLIGDLATWLGSGSTTGGGGVLTAVGAALAGKAVGAAVSGGTPGATGTATGTAISATPFGSIGTALYNWITGAPATAGAAGSGLSGDIVGAGLESVGSPGGGFAASLDALGGGGEELAGAAAGTGGGTFSSFSNFMSAAAPFAMPVAAAGTFLSLLLSGALTSKSEPEQAALEASGYQVNAAAMARLNALYAIYQGGGTANDLANWYLGQGLGNTNTWSYDELAAEGFQLPKPFYSMIYDAGHLPGVGYDPFAYSGGGAQTGALFNTAGPTDLTVGEAGTETVAVLRNPREGQVGGGGVTINLNLSVHGGVYGDGGIEEFAKKLTRPIIGEIRRYFTVNMPGGKLVPGRG